MGPKQTGYNFGAHPLVIIYQWWSLQQAMGPPEAQGTYQGDTSLVVVAATNCGENFLGQSENPMAEISWLSLNLSLEHCGYNIVHYYIFYRSSKYLKIVTDFT